MRFIQIDKKTKIIIIDIASKSAASVVSPWCEMYVGKLVEEKGFFKKKRHSTYVVGFVENFNLSETYMMSSLEECLWFKSQFEEIGKDLNLLQIKIAKEQLAGKPALLLTRELSFAKARAAEIREVLRATAL